MTPNIIWEEDEALAATGPSGCEQRLGPCFLTLSIMQPALLRVFPAPQSGRVLSPHFPHRKQSVHLCSASTARPLRSGQALAGLPVPEREVAPVSGPPLWASPSSSHRMVVRGQPVTALSFSGSPRGEMEEFGRGIGQTASGVGSG